jgi:hypothetical protein
MSVALVQSRWIPLQLETDPQRPPFGGDHRHGPHSVETSYVCLLARTPQRWFVGAILNRLPVLEGTEPAAASDGFLDAIPVADEHLIVEVDKADPHERPVADVIVRRAGHKTPQSTKPLISDPYIRSPGCLVTAVIEPDNRCTVATRDGWSAEVAGWTAEAGTGWSFSWYASFVHFWIVSGQRPDALDGAYLTIARLPHRWGGVPTLISADHHWHHVRTLDSGGPAVA